MLQHQVARSFRERFGEPPAFLVRAPGRVNLIGEHTDYNDGFVLPVAIDRAVWVALRPREDRQVVVHSENYGETLAFSLDGIEHDEIGWGEYVKGVAWALQTDGYALRGWEGVMAGDVPRGAGLSSSAAVELAMARAFAAAEAWAWDPKAMALLGQRVENEWIGVSCGIMDQMVVACAEADAALRIDCRSLAVEPAPLPPGVSVVVMDTGTRRGLVDSAYNERRSQCEAAARFFGVPALRDVDQEAFERKAGGLPDVTRRRARHVVTENARVLEAVEALRLGDADRLGRLMNASHESLRNDFEVSSAALDLMVRLAQHEEGCYGARMTGAGFGGCAVALVEASKAAHFVRAVEEGYRAGRSEAPSLYVCHPSAGTDLADIPEA